MSQEQTEFAEFFESSWDVCLRAVLAVVGSPQQAEDQVAEAFARAWRAWRRVSRHPAPRAWVVRHRRLTGTNACPPAAPRPPRRPTRRRPPVPGNPSPLFPTLPSSAALRSLPPRQREVIALRVFLDMDTDEIAAQLGIASATVRVHLARATAALRQELSPPRTQEVGQ